MDKIDQPTTTAEADLQQANGPEVDETLGAFPTGIQVTFAQMRSVLRGCGHISLSSGGHDRDDPAAGGGEGQLT